MEVVLIHHPHREWRSNSRMPRALYCSSVADRGGRAARCSPGFELLGLQVGQLDLAAAVLGALLPLEFDSSISSFSMTYSGTPPGRPPHRAPIMMSPLP